MPRPRKVPAVLVEATVRRNAKLAGLSSDTARLGFFYVVLGDAKLSEPVPGQFASRALFEDVAGRFAGYLDEYLDAGLIEVAPRLCTRCRERWSAMPPRSGVLVVHDWHEHQYDPRKLERQREYEERQRNGSTHETEVSDGVSDAQSDGVSDAIPTGDSRARRARDVPATRVSHVEREREREHEDSPQPPAGGGRRSNGTNPRAQAKAAADLAAVEQGARRWRSSQRQLAYLRGAITEEQQRDMDQRDAPLTEIPDHEQHRATVAMDARMAEL